MGEKTPLQSSDDSRLGVFAKFIETIEDTLPPLEDPNTLLSYKTFSRRLALLNENTDQQISEDVMNALLSNAMTALQGRELLDTLVDSEWLEAAEEREMKFFVKVIHSVLSVVLEDPDEWFERNSDSKDIIINNLGYAAEEINAEIKRIPERDKELVNTSSELSKLLSSFRGRVENSARLFPSHSQEFFLAFEILEATVSQSIPPFAMTERINIFRIREMLENIFMVESREPNNLRVNPSRLDEVLSALKRLANGEDF